MVDAVSQPGAAWQAPTRILVIDDNPAVLEAFGKILRPTAPASAGLQQSASLLFGDDEAPGAPQSPPLEVDLASGGQAGAQLVALARNNGWPYAVAFVDMRMAGWDGLQTVEAVWQADPDVQVVLCTAYSDVGWGEVTARLGYSDRWLLLKKPFDAIEVQQMAAALALKWRLQQAQRAKVSALEQQIDERARELAYHASHDVLTGLPNRSLFRDLARQAIVYSGREQQQVAIMALRLDRFQVIRQALGDEGVNSLLCTTAGRLVNSLRAQDTVAYLDGKEFAIAIAGLANPDDLNGVAAKLVQAVAAPLMLGQQEICSTASIGISLSGTDGDDTDTLLRHAATAAQCARDAGGNLFRFYAPAMNQRTAARLALEAGLRHAVEQDELLLHYQPKVSLRNGQLTGAEALLRWQHPKSGLIMPGEFIPYAEESGAILPIGLWVLESVCRQLAQWRDAGIPLLPVAINVSVRQFRHRDLAQVLRAMLDKHQLRPGLLELEITESALLEDLGAATATLRELKAIGVKLTLDDFGTGYSSLSYLQQFPVDQVKIDRSFVRDVTINPSDAAICRAVIELAHALQLRVIGEGIETQGQLNYLRMRHCDEMQGYYFSRPVPVAEYTQMLHDGRSLVLAQAGAGPQRTLLVVDDEPNILAALQRLFRRSGFHVLTAGSGSQGLALLAEHRVQVVLSDQRMPEMSGTDFLARVRSLYPETIRMILTGYTDLDTVVSAINRGTLFKFLTKPWDEDALCQQILEAFQYYEMRAGKQ